LATQLNLTVVAIKSNSPSPRQRCRELLRTEIRATVASTAEVDEEIRYLIQIFESINRRKVERQPSRARR